MKQPTTLNLTVDGLSASTINRHITQAQRIDLRMAPQDKPDSSGVWWALAGLALVVVWLLVHFVARML